VKAPAFDYQAPESVEEALALLREFGDDARLLAGGQSLVPLMNFRLARPSVVIDLNRLDDLSYVVEEDDGLRVGAMTRQAQVEMSDRVAAGCPLLAKAIPFVAHAAIRNRGTIGGSLAHADPAAELGAVVSCLDAELELRSHAGARRVTARDFFQGAYGTCIQPTEMITEVRLPRSRDGATAFVEVSRREGDFALAGIAALVELDEQNRCRDARIAFCGVESLPWRPAALEAALRGEALGKDLLDEVSALAADGMESYDDVHASASYRRHLSVVLCRQALGIAAARAEEKRNCPSKKR
jgi:carbon-monoxide dehydrogenase medium subunit